METETIDRLYLELSQVTKAETPRELALKASLRRCLREAEGWLDDARGCKPCDVIGYDGWADEARRLLGDKGVHGEIRMYQP